MLKHYIEYLYPGTFISDTSVAEVKDRSPITSAQLPDRAYGYRFFDRTETNVEGENLKGAAKNYSNWTYKGEPYTLSQIKEHYPQNDILISNMENNGFKRVLKCYQGFIPLNEEDKVF